MKLVLAGNKKQYDNWLRENHLNPAEYRFICKPEHIRGYNPIKIIKVGTYWENPLYKNEILKEWI